MRNENTNAQEVGSRVISDATGGLRALLSLAQDYRIGIVPDEMRKEGADTLSWN